MGLREICPTRRAMAAGFPGMGGWGVENEIKRMLANKKATAERKAERELVRPGTSKPRPMRADIFKAYRAAGCSIGGAAKRLDYSPSGLNLVIDRLGLRSALKRIKERSRENEHEDQAG